MNQQEYNDKFKIPKPTNTASDEIPVYEKALGYALDIRKFEIDLYWKRATYFWTFIVAQYSVSKINQILSVFISLFWLLLIIKSILPLSPTLPPDYFKICVLLLTSIAIICLFYFGTSSNNATETKLKERAFSVKP